MLLLVSATVQCIIESGNHCAGGCTFISPCWGQDANGLVVPRETVNTGLDENQAEFGVFVFPISFKMFADGHSLPLISTRV